MTTIQFLRPARARNAPATGERWTRYNVATWWGRVLEDLRTGGEDPAFRKAMIVSFVTHFMIIVVIPLLLALFTPGVAAYRLPKGSGVPDPAGMAAAAEQQQQAVQVRMVKAKPKRKFMVRSDSPIIFSVPELDDMKQLEQLQKDTELTYKAGQSALDKQSRSDETAGGMVKGGTGKSKGKLGAGGGTQGGWPDGVENALIRFIRLDHGGPNWNDGMSNTDRSDLNFLEEFGKYTGFKVARETEGYKIAQIAGMAKGTKPPFLYMTGTGGIPMGGRDLQQLQAYLREGGMLFVDAGSPEFHRHFVNFANQLVPGSRLVQIADDDPIFREPFTLPNGAPPLWHHGGYKALGLKMQDRWVVFYHPGDLKDAFRTGNSGLDPTIVRSAHQTGINVLYYAFTRYLAANRPDSKK